MGLQMSEMFSVWKEKKTILVVILTAFIYAILLIPFKQFSIIVGITELRPAGVIPVLFGIFFGPAAAWGSAIGNLVGDFFGTLTPASVFGFVGNFIYAYAAFRVWRLFVRKEEKEIKLRQFGVYFLAIAVACLACAFVIAEGADLLGFVPFWVLFDIIFVNNLAMSAALGPIPLKLLSMGRSRKKAIEVNLKGS